jgi:hypothetical protein
MDFYTVLDQAVDLLRQRGRVTYRALKLQFTLDDDQLEALKDELLYVHPQVVDDAGRGPRPHPLRGATARAGDLAAGPGAGACWARPGGGAGGRGRRGEVRLLSAFGHSHPTHGWRVLESASVSYGKATPYGPVVDLLKRDGHVEARDDSRTLRATVTGQLLTLDEALGMRPLQAHCHRGLGMLYGTLGRQEQARCELSTAIEMYRTTTMTFWLN